MDKEFFEMFRERYLDGDVETFEDRTRYRGPIASLEIDGSKVIVVCEWVAKSEDRGTTWSAWHRTTFEIPLIAIREDASGRLTLNLGNTGTGVMYPRGTNTLDPSRVRDLTLTS